MSASLLSPEQLAGVREKLKRADENILNLNTEISAFLKKSPDGGVGNDKTKAVEKWAKHHAQRPIPPRFPVIAGEVIHHLRSCLDHITWMLSRYDYRNDPATKKKVAFPIFTKLPKEKAKTRYDGNVAGITSRAALKLIEDLQPYKVTQPANHPLAIIQCFDNIDKHHNLVLVEATFDAHIQIPSNLFTSRAIIGLDTSEDAYWWRNQPAQQANIQVARQVAFAEFGERKNQPLIPALQQLADAIREIVRQFSEL
jgi:hypothetical protein